MRSLLFVVISIIIYGSLFPFNFVAIDITQVAWFDWGTELEQRTTNGDILSNFLTFIPFAYFAFLVNPLRQNSFFLRSLSVLIFGLVLAYTLQVAQFFLPSRIPTVADVIINFWGICAGITCALLVTYNYQKNPDKVSAWPVYSSALTMLIACWVIYRLFPLFPEFSLDNIITSLSPLWPELAFNWVECLYLCCLWWAFFSMLVKDQWNNIQVSHAVSIVVGILIVEIFIQHNVVDLTDLIAASLAIVLFFCLPQKFQIPSLLIGLVCAYFLHELQNLEKLETSVNVNWIPLKTYLRGSMWVNTHDFLEKLFLFGAMLFFSTVLLSRILLATLVCLLIVISVECLQYLLNLGHADISDPLILLLLGLVLGKLESLPLYLEENHLRRSCSSELKA